MLDPNASAIARKATLDQLATAYEEFAELEQLLVADGMYEEAEVAHDRALATLFAYDAELNNPKPKPTCGCVNCGMYRVGLRRLA